MGHLIPGDAYMLVARVLVVFVWSITPACWVILVSRLVYLAAAPRYPPLATQAALLQSHPLLQHLCPTRHPWFFNGLFVYCAVEAAFSIYHARLARKIQAPGPRPLYGKRFIRTVFAKALESGLKQPNGTNDTARASGRLAPPRQNGSATALARPSDAEATAAAEDVRRRMGRLRTASFVPNFVHRPLEHDDPRAIRFQQAQSKWFFGAHFDHITRRDIQQWLAWSIFGTTLEEIEDEHRRGSAGSGSDDDGSPIPSAVPSPMPPSIATFGGAAPLFLEEEDVQGARAAPGEWDPTKGDRLQFIEYCRELLEVRQGRPYPLRSPQWADHHDEASSPRLRMMRLTVDPVRVSGRPLASYVVTNTLSHLVIRKAIGGGFKRKIEGRLPYLLRVPKAWDAKTSKAPPLIFLHGLGIGLAQYASLVDFFLASPVFQDRPVLILLQPNISQAIHSSSFLSPFGHHETTAAFRRIIASNGWHESGITVLSHSYGSLVHSWLLKSLGTLVRRSCFVDPVCFQLWVPHVCGNFLYKRVETPIELLMRYFVARELGTANTLCRYFQWSSSLLWPDEIPNLTDASKTRFYLAEHDAILHAGETREYLFEMGLPARCLFFGEGKVHGEMLMHGGPEFNEIVEWLLLDPDA
ncbi:uncharacterized protein PFL1_03672 [Pseudozyma flocculosa PF-1]|uniref:AB hydrolase-1 domain-containing protein n=2 Tax=Pseudozyma flocculosa TaxID=84751 RepID=A0A5C3F4E8_9BASI|nr:uncharacterized protein PFL1_03672 [Pseudozyma flocculosa PF-1]EPQ28870.1 hypothetical protein PFL1_03672 [Pseudozyma flocculosa PF-1]SPO39338.1 uncharacterized protein PSFLO_04819 [Pseudozyma flocculosa]